MTTRASRTNHGIAEWHRSLEDLRRPLTWSDDWDGEGAVQPKPELVRAAMDWLHRLPVENPAASPPSYVTATPCGEVAIVWQSGEEVLAAEFVEPDRIERMRRSPGQAGKHWVSTARCYDLTATGTCPSE